MQLFSVPGLLAVPMGVIGAFERTLFQLGDHLPVIGR